MEGIWAASGAASYTELDINHPVGFLTIPLTERPGVVGVVAEVVGVVGLQWVELGRGDCVPGTRWVVVFKVVTICQQGVGSPGSPMWLRITRAAR